MGLLDKIREHFATPASPAIFTAEGEAGALLADLHRVIDPEVGLDIVTMGLIRELSILNGHACITMTLTTPGCPMAGQLIEEIELIITDRGLKPAIDLTFDPPWRPEHMSEEGRTALG